jgi:hypothetical protein
LEKVMKASTIKTAQEGDASVIGYHAVIHLTSKKIYFNCRVWLLTRLNQLRWELSSADNFITRFLRKEFLSKEIL